MCADGIGSGIRANVAAGMCTARLLELMRVGFSPRRAFASLVATMEQAKTDATPYSAFSLVRVLNEGETTVLSYEAPPPLIVAKRHAVALPQRTVVIGSSLTGEANCHLEPGEAIMVFSDGITQAGLGGKLKRGWQVEGACHYVDDLLATGVPLAELPVRVARRAADLSAGTPGDDCTVVVAACRWGNTVNILTGPPADRRTDREVAHNFLATEGTKVICGATTAEIVARALGAEVTVDRSSRSLLAPPSYVLPGVDLVTEGAVTLNQLYNVLDEDRESFEEDSGVTELHELLLAADRVSVFLGSAQNPANKHISFRQRGILPRAKIIELLAEKLQAAGKLVVIRPV